MPGTGSNPDGADSAEGANRAVAHNNPNAEDIEYDGTVGGDNARHPLETEAAPPEVAGDDAIDFTVEPPEPELPEAEADDGFGVDDGVSMGLDFIPFVGAGKSIAQLFSGTDLITGEPVNRWIEAAGILAGFVGAAGIVKGALRGGSAVLKHGDEVADVAKTAMKNADTVTRSADDIAEAAAKKADDIADARVSADTVFSGHGAHSNKLTTVPEGTSVTVYSGPGGSITDKLGNKIETGGDLSKVPKKTYLSGEKMPDNILYEPKGLDIKGNPVTVEKPTRLSELLKPDMGECHWAACTSASGEKFSDTVFHTDGMYDQLGKKIKSYD